MNPKSRAFIALLIVIAVGLAGLILRGHTVQVDLEEWPALAVGDERTVTLAVMWDGDVVQSERLDCGVWAARWDCELRRGGGGVVISRTLPISATAAVGEAGSGQWGTENILTWDTGSLPIGDYETFVRLAVTDGTETRYGYIGGEGHDGQYFHMVDKFHMGQACLFPLRIDVRK